MYHVNINNLDAKNISLKSTLSNHSYSLVTLNETHCKAGRKVVIPDYLTYTRNRVDKACGGIATSIKLSDAHNVVRIDEGKEDNEFIVTRHGQIDSPINIINKLS